MDANVLAMAKARYSEALAGDIVLKIEQKAKADDVTMQFEEVLESLGEFDDGALQAEDNDNTPEVGIEMLSDLAEAMMFGAAPAAQP
ncbi:hypothetical protein CYMTET_48059 [Cymbomonas tetramitiformis]|uniref:Uncharacterized protein n=1 Tax=Cymbomonas tetramitiformis TaxID=36881 RepID=A0AAE0EVI8_9CHLO|nr:hypothetical protein CYMTET_48059 [Cymbomonas tetramitiformis]